MGKKAKKETELQKEKRVEKELNDQLEKNGKIEKLTDDQRYILYYIWGYDDAEYKCFSYPNIGWEDNISCSADQFIASVSVVAKKAEDWANKSDLVQCIYYMDSDLYVSGFDLKNDAAIIKAYTKRYEQKRAANQRREEAEKKRKEEEKNIKLNTKKAKNCTVMIGGKKYKLVEEK